MEDGNNRREVSECLTGARPVYEKVLVKLSGEAFMDSSVGYGIDTDVVFSIAEQLSEVHRMGVHVAAVVGGGNIFRGGEASARGIDRVTADFMGMLATVMNALALQDALEKKGVNTRVQTAINMQEVAEPYIRRRALRHQEKGRVVLFAAGTGNPYFTTDTAAALRAVEIEADLIIKGTRVEGVYDSDPEKNPKAFKYRQISYKDVIEKGLRVMDLTAITLCKENKMPIVILNMNKTGNLLKLLRGERVGTLISDQKTIRA